MTEKGTWMLKNGDETLTEAEFAHKLGSFVEEMLTIAEKNMSVDNKSTQPNKSEL